MTYCGTPKKNITGVLKDQITIFFATFISPITSTQTVALPYTCLTTTIASSSDHPDLVVACAECNKDYWWKKKPEQPHVLHSYECQYVAKRNAL